MNAIALDLETTGPDPETAKIVQLGVAIPRDIECGGSVLINPEKPIPEEATAVHGISNEDVADAPPFRAIADRVRGVLGEWDYLITYNGRTFDVPILDRELREAGEPGVDAAEIEEIDLYRVWKELEPRTLETAVERFGGDGEFDAHDAFEDARVLFDVLNGMNSHLGPNRMDPPFRDYAKLTTPDDAVDRFGYFCREDGVVLFDFGKHRGEPVAEHLDYLDWMETADFPASVTEIAREEIESTTGAENG